MTVDGVYRTESGLVFKLEREADGQIKVYTYEDGTWNPASPKLTGLRLNPTTKRLTARQGAALGA